MKAWPRLCQRAVVNQPTVNTSASMCLKTSPERINRRVADGFLSSVFL